MRGTQLYPHLGPGFCWFAADFAFPLVRRIADVDDYLAHDDDYCSAFRSGNYAEKDGLQPTGI